MTSPVMERNAGGMSPAWAIDPRRIREFAPTDAAAVAEVFNDSEEGWPGGFLQGTRMTAERVLRRQREQQPLATFIAWEGDRATGYCSLFEYPDEHGTAGFIGLLNVSTSFQGRGYGRDLLMAALARTIALGYTRLDLGTWAGNMKAVPLYKKTGFFWVPESNVHMENYLPLLLGMPILSGFWAEADWYGSTVRDLSVKEDLILQGKMRVYPYEFRHGDRFVKATVDASARGLTALETEQWCVSCTVEDRTLIVGRPRTVRWQVENRTGRPLPLTLLAGAGNGLHLRKEDTGLVHDRYTAEAQVTADLDYQPPVFGQRAPCVESLLLLDGQPIRLETGVEVRRPFSVRLDPDRANLPTGQTREITLQVRNYMDEPATARLTIVPSPALSIEGREHISHNHGAIELPMAAESYAGQTLRITASATGAHALEVRPTALVDGAEVPMAPIQLPLPAIGPGELVALIADKLRNAEHLDREVRVESSTHRLVVDLREGGWQLQDAATAAGLAGGLVPVGPPFSWTTQSRVVHTPSIERRDGALAVTLRGAVPHLPHAAVEHEFLLLQDGLLRVQTSIACTGADLEEAQTAVWVWGNRDTLPTMVLPTVHGLIASDDSEWPDWSEPALQDPAIFDEGWVAQQSDARVVGLIWSEAARIELGRWMLSVRQDAGPLEPGARRTLPPIYVYAGPGNWQTVRARWRSLIRPDAGPPDPLVREAVQLTAPVIPAALLTGPTTLQLRALTDRETSGRLTFEAPEGWQIQPATHDAQGLRVDRAAEIRVEAHRLSTAARAAEVRARLRTDRADITVLDGSLLDLGSGDTVRIDELAQAGHRLVQVDNGFLRFRVAPDFLGSVVALDTVADGINHLLSPFPEPREFGWMRPWYGGLYAAVYGADWDGFPGHARLYEESLGAEAVEETGHEGRCWRGVLVRGTLTGKGLRGLELRTSYLTLPGSNLLAIRVAVRNDSSATLTVHPAVVAYLQPDGTTEGAELLTGGAGQGRRLLRAQRTIGVPTDGWVAARNPATGRTVALIGGVKGAEAQVVGEDWGLLGAHAGVKLSFRLQPGEEQSVLSFLAIARDEAEARAYRVLRGATQLP